MPEHTARIRAWLALMLSVLLWCAGVAAVAAADESEVDPRPHVLVLGSSNCLPWAVDPAWPDQIADRLPDLRLTTVAKREGLLHEARQRINKTLDQVGPVDVVILLFGQAEADAERFRGRDAERFQRDLIDLVRRIRRHRHGRGAQVCIATPVPIRDAWLDHWMANAYSPEGHSGEAASRALAAAARLAATATEVPLIDLYAWASTQGDDGERPNRLVGPTGIFLQDDGHQCLADFFYRQITEVVVPAPRDPAAAAADAAERSAHRALDEVLADTASGRPRIGRMLEPMGPRQEAEQRFAVPVELLTGPTLDLLVESATPKHPTAITVMGLDRRKGQGVRLEITPNRGRDLQVVMPSHSWRPINAASPDEIADKHASYHHSGRYRYRPLVVGGREAQQVLLRIPLDAINGEALASAELVIHHGSVDQLEVHPDAAVTVSPILAPDNAWSLSSATWRQRDAHHPWTGGEVDEPARRRALAAFLASEPPLPAAVQARARAELQALNRTGR